MKTIYDDRRAKQLPGRYVERDTGWEVFKGIMAFTLVEATQCKSEVALAAVERQFTSASEERPTAANCLDHLMAAKMDIMEPEDG